MDSLTQIALGSAVAVAVVGRKSSVKKAALWGAVAGTLPDLDILIDYGDALSNMVYHRGFSHALFYLTLLSPLLALLICKIHQQMPLYRHWLLAIWLVLITHPLLDTLTIYGTQLALPFSNHPFAVGSIFIIDPLYTLPLLLGLAWVLWRGKRALAANTAALVFSSCYLLWGLAAQQHVLQVAAKQPVSNDARVLVVPTALNTLLWRVLLVTEEAYYEGFYSLLEKNSDIVFQRYVLDPELYQRYQQHPDVQTLATFSQGFYALEQQGEQVVITDLRMGQQQNYAFSFVLAEEPGQPASRLPRQLQLAETVSWVWRTLTGELSAANQLPRNLTSPDAVAEPDRPAAAQYSSH
ncbi:membrane-bound metal-dependent hydrolase [Alishewanella aestuarii B11]|uniref:Membrane-bound metal-dependent hydrolase n=1 Tax=Alishewanella aestuarii B11 TaxID=1197174 RepID=J2ICR5_9ALTE|nr:metal-dependent hydrolase [Alishewanella aestuarii]EJI84927.1 membrane-bound metal-dependent hydrolase [Alishewanella aestuarii B11]